MVVLERKRDSMSSVSEYSVRSVFKLKKLLVCSVLAVRFFSI